MPSSRQARRTRTAISPRLAIRILWKVFTAPPGSHAKNAEPALEAGRVQGYRQGQCKHMARFRRIDDPVVPQAGGGVIRAALGFIFFENGLLKPGCFLRAE